MNNKDNTSILETLENIENKFKSTIKEMNERFRKIEEQTFMLQREIDRLRDSLFDNY